MWFLTQQDERACKVILHYHLNTVVIDYIDDLNMPAKEIYGAQPPIELLRQWIDHEHWYDKKDTSKLIIIDVLFISAMGPPGGGKNDITGMVTILIYAIMCINVSKTGMVLDKMLKMLGRLTRHLNVISINSFDDETLKKIFGSITDWHFSKGFDSCFGR